MLHWLPRLHLGLWLCIHHHLVEKLITTNIVQGWGSITPSLTCLYQTPKQICQIHGWYLSKLRCIYEIYLNQWWDWGCPPLATRNYLRLNYNKSKEYLSSITWVNVYQRRDKKDVQSWFSSFSRVPWCVLFLCV